MIRRRKPRSLSLRYQRRSPRVVLWSIALLTAIGLLLGLAYLVGHGPLAKPTVIAEISTTATMPVVAVALAVAILLAAAWCFRHLCFDWLAWRPGRIEVDTFTADSALIEADVAQHTLLFRSRLADLRMRAPASVPGAGPEGDFLEVLGRAGVDSRNWLGSALSLLRAAKPRHAWQVSGVLVKRNRRPRCGLTVQIQRLPDQGNPPKTHWGDTWAEAVRKGADHATAVIVPRTRRCGAPWSAWKRFVMDGELIGAYEDALVLERERRYDEALDGYYRASGMDPLNMTLRLQIGQLQEKLELYLDALHTYQAMITVDEQQVSAGGLRAHRRARNEHERAILLARYRRMVLLSGEELVDQWRKTGRVSKSDWSQRDVRRANVRQRLRRQLKPALERAVSRPNLWQRLLGRTPGRSRAGERTVAQLIEEPPPGLGHELPVDDEEKKLRLELRELFALAALADRRSVLVWSWLQLGDGRLALSPDSVRLTNLCIQVRLDWIQYELKGHSESWPPDVEKLKEDVEGIEARSGFHRWHEHYNAACAYALPLLVLPKVERGRRRQLTKDALERLAKAAALTNSAYIVGRRDWLLSEDPDLDGLRPERRFKDFEATYFPAERATPERWRHVKKLQNARYIRELLLATAERWEQVWHARWEKLERRPDVHAALAWWDHECTAWELVGDVARNYRHWLVRWKLLDRMRDWGVMYGFEPLEVPFPRYEDEPLTAEEMRADSEPALKAANTAADRFEEIGKEVRKTEAIGSAAADLREIDRLRVTLRQLDADGREPRRLVLAVLCDQHAAMWQRLREWLEADPDAEGDAAEAFRDQVERTAQIWRNAHRWWRKPLILRAGGRSVIYRRRGVRNGELVG